MLEESAAQLAALRQRAEFLLDQFSNDRVDGSAPAGADGRDVIPPPTTDDHDGGGAAIDESAQTPFEERLFPLPLENDIKPAGAHDALSTDQQTPDQHSETPGSNLPAAYADGSTPDIPSSGPSFASHSPQGTGLLLSEFSGRSSAGKTNNNRSSIDSPLDETAQSSAYPIQRHHSQPTSILDRPIGATQPPFSRVAETRFDVTATDVQVVEDEIVSLYKAINRVKQSPRENTGHALSLLREAREIMLAEPQRIERVEYNIQQGAPDPGPRQSQSQTLPAPCTANSFAPCPVARGPGRAGRGFVLLSTKCGRDRSNRRGKNRMAHLALVSRALGRRSRRSRRLPGHDLFSGGADARST